MLGVLVRGEPARWTDAKRPEPWIALVGWPWWVALAVPVTLTIVYFTAVQPEEAYLETKFGEEYRRYTEKVRRWI